MKKTNMFIEYEECNNMFILHLNSLYSIEYMIESGLLYFCNFRKIGESAMEYANNVEIADKRLGMLFNILAQLRNSAEIDCISEDREYIAYKQFIIAKFCEEYSQLLN